MPGRIPLHRVESALVDQSAQIPLFYYIVAIQSSFLVQTDLVPYGLKYFLKNKYREIEHQYKKLSWIWVVPAYIISPSKVW